MISLASRFREALDLAERRYRERIDAAERDRCPSCDSEPHPGRNCLHLWHLTPPQGTPTIEDP